MRCSATVAVLAVVVLSAPPCDASMIIYSNRSVAEYGTDNSSQIGPPHEITQLFSLSQNATATSAMIGVWIPATSDHLGLLSVTYKLGTTQNGSDLGTAMVPVTSTYLYTNTRGYDIFKSEFSLPASMSQSLSANTNYYFTLSNAATNFPTFIFWDNRDQGPVQSLTLFGDSVSGVTPEPSTVVLALTALPILVGRVVRVRRSCAAT